METMIDTVRGLSSDELVMWASYLMEKLDREPCARICSRELGALARDVVRWDADMGHDLYEASHLAHMAMMRLM